MMIKIIFFYYYYLAEHELRYPGVHIPYPSTTEITVGTTTENDTTSSGTTMTTFTVS